MNITNEILKNAIENSKNKLIKLSEDIEKITFPDSAEIEFSTNKLNDKYIADILTSAPAGYAQKFEDTDFIYIFSIVEPIDTLNAKIYSALCESREIQSSDEFEGKKDFCRPNNQSSNYLYVGRSQKLRSRLKQHLDAGNDGVFAMHMLRWVAGINVKIKISYYQFDGLDNLTVQALEDALWESFNPMFGKKGDK